jgi:PLP dependent protein
LNFQQVISEIQNHEKLSGRSSGSVQLLAVSKSQSIEKIRELYKLGQRNFGENYAQELCEKADLLSDLPDLKWHFIGHLQSNKVKMVLPHVQFLHSLNRVSLVKELTRQMAFCKSYSGTLTPENRLTVFVQLQLNPLEDSKSGATLKEAQSICAELSKSEVCSKLNWVGFMGIGSTAATEHLTQKEFRNFAESAQELWAANARNGQPILSLGMSADLGLAIEAGSHWVRVGTALFGARNPSANKD